MSDRKPIHPNIPLNKAWQEGRRIYVVSDYGSPLADALWKLGGTWDKPAGARWVGSSKKEAVIEVVLSDASHADALAEQRAQAEAIKALGLWEKISYEAIEVREIAKRLGAVYDGQRKEWACPTAEARAQLAAAARDWKANRDAKREAATTLAARPLNEVMADLLAARGRTPIGEPVKRVTRSTGGRMRRSEAEKWAPTPGQIRTDADGLLWLVVRVNGLNFLNEDTVEDLMPGRDPHWCCDWTGIQVQPDADELAARERDAARAAQVAELDEVMTAAAAFARPAPLDRRAGSTITLAARGMAPNDGKIIVDEGGRVWYQHPGTYDMWISAEGQITDADLIAKIEALIAAGSRTIERYTITTVTRPTATTEQTTTAPQPQAGTKQDGEAALMVAALRAAGRTVRQIATEIGCAASTVYRWAHGVCRPCDRYAAALAAVLA